VSLDDGGSGTPFSVGLRDRLLATRSLGIFEAVDEDGATLLAEYSTVATFRRGAEVTDADEKNTSLHLIVEGGVRLERTGGRPPIRLGAGSPVGLLRVLTEGQMPRSVAEAPTRTLQISREAFLAALEQNFSLLRSVFRLVSGTMLDVQGALPVAVPEPALTRERPVRPLTLVERARDLANTGPFRGANIDAIFDTARLMREGHVQAEHVFWGYGDQASMAVRVVSGSVICTDGLGRTSAIGPGFVIGTLAAFAGRAHPYAARALSAVRVYEIDFEDLLVVLEAHPELALTFLSNLARTVLQAL
jgi:CRP-like cAMP-binding protein